MLHVVLLILKIIGWILLGILGLLIGLILLVLLVPVRYRVEGSYYGKPEGTARITWLLHMISVRASYKEDLDMTVRLFGFRIFKEAQGDEELSEAVMDMGEEAKDALVDIGEEAEESLVDIGEETEEPLVDTVREPNGSAARRIMDDPLIKKTPFDKEDSFETEGPRESDEAPPDTGETPQSPKGIRAFATRVLEKIKFLFHTVCDRLKFIKENYEMILAFLQDQENQKTFRLILHQLKKLFRHILPRKAEGKVIFGFDDPYTTGQVLAAASVFYAWYGQKIEIVPVFEEAILEGELKLKGRIRMGTILWHCLRVYLNKNFRILLKRFTEAGKPHRRAGKRNKGGF